MLIMHDPEKTEVGSNNVYYIEGCPARFIFKSIDRFPFKGRFFLTSSGEKLSSFK
jgi:hypothetical protein